MGTCEGSMFFIWWCLPGPLSGPLSYAQKLYPNQRLPYSGFTDCGFMNRLTGKSDEVIRQLFALRDDVLD